MLGGCLWLLLLCFGLISAGHALVFKRDPRSALGWTLLCLLLPGLGALCYWLLGVNRIRTRARRWQERGRMRFVAGERGVNPATELPAPYRSGNFTALLSLSDAVNRRPLLGGNRVRPLHNGEAAYPAMLDAISRAEKSVHLSSYIFDTDSVGQAFCDALAAACARGVDVRVLIDALGERYSRPVIHRIFRRRNIPHARFLPFSLSGPGFFVNLRNHRKLLIVDNEVGFTGGMNISERHLAGRSENPNRVIDLHFCLQGPIVGQMQEAFLEDWAFATRTPPEEPPPAPAAAVGGEAFCRGISSGPNEDFDQLPWMFVGALNCARKRICIMTPYFIPDIALASALSAAALRGVQVDIVLPGKNNLRFVDWASRAYLHDLIMHNVHIHYQPPPFVHTKLLMIDNRYALAGSANLDPRSFLLNFEFNVEILDQAVVAELVSHFDAARAASRPLTLNKLRRQPFLIRLRNGIAKVFSPYL